jgi:hypothetical protein
MELQCGGSRPGQGPEPRIYLQTKEIINIIYNKSLFRKTRINPPKREINKCSNITCSVALTSYKDHRGRYECVVAVKWASPLHFAVPVFNTP